MFKSFVYPQTLTEKTDYTESAILFQLSSGSEQAFHLLYERWHRKIYSYIFTITGSRPQSEDATQEVFIRIWRERGKLKDIQNFEAWLFTVVRRLALNCLRSMANEQKLYQSLQEITLQKSFETFRDEAVTADQKKAIASAIQRLPPQQRAVYELSHIHGLSRNEIAEKLNLSPNTVRNHLNAALISLRACLQHYYLEGLFVFPQLVHFFI